MKEKTDFLNIPMILDHDWFNARGLSYIIKDINVYLIELLLTALTCKPANTAPTNGQLACTNGNNFESVCTYSCDNGYGLSDLALTTSTCNDNGDNDADGVWSSIAPTCVGEDLSLLIF